MEIKRRCVITHQILDRSNLFRVVKDKDDNVSIDLSYNKQGRGAYILKDKDVILQAKKKDALTRALHHKVDGNIYDQLLELLKGE